jgi:hypothetical protein
MESIESSMPIHRLIDCPDFPYPAPLNFEEPFNWGQKIGKNFFVYSEGSSDQRKRARETLFVSLA